MSAVHVAITSGFEMSRPGRRGPWLPEEDRTLLHLVQTQGANNWVRIAQQLQHRSPKQCRERYHQNLKPSLKHEPISAHEGEIIEQMVAEMGKRWAEIARHLGNRSDNAVKNWWNGSMNRRRRNPTQASTGFKHVGTRLHPVPFTKPDVDESISQLRRLPHPVNTTSVLSRTPLYRSPCSYESDTYSIASPLSHERYHASHLPSSYGRIPDTPHSERSIRSPISSTTAYSQHSFLPRPSTLDRKPDLPPLRQITRDGSVDSRYPTVELPLVSPALTESSRSVRPAPSLVSDNLSIYSASPRTTTSPQPNSSRGSPKWQYDSEPFVLRLTPPASSDILDSPKQYHAAADMLAAVHKTKDRRMHVSNLLD